jgi:hypothetical protein
MGFLLAFMSIAFTTSAQDPSTQINSAGKTSLFAKLPSKLACNRPELEKVLRYKKSEQISLKLSDNLVLSGEVIEKTEATPGVQNVNIRLSNYGNALLTVSIFTNPDNTNSIVGRIIHPRHAEALVISEENGKYYVTKHKMEFFMVE